MSSKGKIKAAELLGEISETHGAIALEMAARLRNLAGGRALSETGIFGKTRMEKKLVRLQGQLADMEMTEATNAFTGLEATEKIERGIELGLYSNIEIVMYKQISGQLNAALGEIGGSSKKALERIRLEGYDGLSGRQKKLVEEALSLVAHLECDLCFGARSE